MEYASHKHAIKDSFPELTLELLDESEFCEFRNIEFALACINYSLDLCNNAAKKLDINLHFGVIYNHAFNAKAIVKDKVGLIAFNLGLIENIENNISDSIRIFMSENIASITLKDDDNIILKNVLTKCCISYLFNHELAHILQIFESDKHDHVTFQELYSENKKFEIKNHIYEIDADNFGASMGTYVLINEMGNLSGKFNSVELFNFLTAYMFTFANIIIQFSNNFHQIYFYSNSHPHPLLRIVTSLERILHFAKNLNISNEFLITILRRSLDMTKYCIYGDSRIINYSELYISNSVNIEKYIDEIETFNESYPELTRFKSQKIFDILTE